jgi:hypothetical protein
MVASVAHLEWGKDLFVQEDLVWSAGYLFNQVAKQNVARVAVSPLCARFKLQRSIAKAGDRRPPIEITEQPAYRSMEMLEDFGFADNVAREAYWVNETTFWRPSAMRDARAGRIQDVKNDLSEMPHTS